MTRKRFHEGAVTLGGIQWVETHPRFFFEGAWNGDFPSGDASKATVCLGSGGTLDEEGVILK